MGWNEKRIKVVLRRYNGGEGIDGGKGRAEIFVNFVLDRMKWMGGLLIEFRRIACDSFLDMNRNVAQRRCEQCVRSACACGRRGGTPSKISERTVTGSTSTCTSPKMGRVLHGHAVAMVTSPFLSWAVCANGADNMVVSLFDGL